MLKFIGGLTVVLVAGAAGFVVRGFVAVGGPPPGAPAMGKMPPPAVVAQEVKNVPLDILEEYIGKVEPVQEVMVASEVAGYIDQVHFTEGAVVQEGQLLFTIDQKQYQALVNVREAELERAKSELDRCQKYLNRLRKASQRSISETDIETAESAELQAAAAFKQAQASLSLAQIDLAYSEIHSPISGRIGEAKLTKGNYVTPSSGALARIIQVDPIRVVFSMTDRAYLSLRQQELAGKENGMVATVRLPNGVTPPIEGKKDFDDNAMNAATGTMAVRYLFDNPDQLLVSGGYVKIMLGQPERPMGIRIPQQCVLVDPQGSYVLTVTAEGLVKAARVKLGRQAASDVVVESGLKAGDRVVVEGVQKVQPGVTAGVTMKEAL